MNKLLRLLSLVLLMATSSLLYAQTTVTFDATTDIGADGSSAKATSITKDGITIAVSNGILGNGLQYRCYKSQTMSVTSTVGNITNIEMTCTASGTTQYGPGCFTAGTGTYTYSENVGKWIGNAAEVIFTASTAQVRMTKIEVTYSGSSTKKSAALAFSETSISLEKGSEFTAPTFSKATTAEVTFSSDNESVATVNSEGVITLGGSEGTATITASSAENDEYYAGTATCKVTVYSYKVYTKATTVESGKEYLIVAQRNDSTFYAYPLGESNNYGYLSVGKIGKLTDTISVKTTYDDDFTITATTDGYTIQDCYSRYLYQSGTYNTFSVSTTNAAVWTIEAQSDGTFKIAQNGYFVQWGQGTYTTFGVYTEIQENAVLPMLYVYDEKATAGITTVKTQPAANNAIYNLAGQRVSENYRGVVIKNGKKYVQNK